jgi:hypothetical protein
MGDFTNILKEEVEEKPTPTQDTSSFIGILQEPIEEKIRDNPFAAIEPDRAGEIYNKSKETGLSLSVVNSSLEDIKKQTPEYDVLVDHHGTVRSFRDRDIITNSMTADDIENLNVVAGIWEKAKATIKQIKEEPMTLGGIAKSMGVGIAEGVADIPRAFGEFMTFIEPHIVDERKLEYRDKFLEPITISKDLRSWLQSKYGKTKAEELITSSFRSIGTMGALFATGGTSVVLPGMAGVSGMSKTTEALEEGSTVEKAVIAGALQAATEYFTEKIPFERLKAPAISFINRLATGLVTDAAGEMAATVIEMELIDEEVLGNKHTKDQLEQALVDTILISGITTTTITPPSHILVKTQDDIDKSEGFHDDNMELNESINNTNTKKRSSDHANEFLNMLGMGQPIYLSSKGIDVLYQENERKDADNLLQKLGVNPDTAKETVATGQDTEIIQSDAHSKLEREEFNKIVKDLKPAPSAYTQRELENQIHEDDVKQAVKLQEEKAKEEAKVKEQLDRLETEIKATKISEEAAQRVPMLLDNMAERISHNSEQSKAEILQDLSFKRLPFERFKQIVEKGKAFFQSAFHGTPFRFDKFSLEHLGKGEGAQAFGWGLYFAEKKDIADWYRKNLTIGVRTFKNQDISKIEGELLKDALVDMFVRTKNLGFNVAKEITIAEMNDHIRFTDDSIEIAKKSGRNIEKLASFREEATNVKEIIKDSSKKDFREEAGATFKVELPGDDQIFEWEKTLGEQSQPIKDKLRMGISKTKNLEGFLDEEFFNDFKGKDFYFELSSVVGSVKAASQWLSDHGIKGHKFWDGSSRNRAGAKTFNFVIYDDEVIDIVETFFQAQKGAPPKGGFSVLEDGRKLISLFETADLSTILHETAHFAFNEYIELERTGMATESLLKDLETVRQWVGAEKGAELTTPQLEQFAKGFELWLFEGKAPTVELESAFARFQRWLANVYKTLKNAREELGIKLNNKIRSVFDRMVMINEDVTTATEGLSILTDEDLNNLGVIEEDKRFMKRSIKDVMHKAEKTLSKKLNKDYENNLKKWESESEKELREENPIYNTIDNVTGKVLRAEQVEELEHIKREIQTGHFEKRSFVIDERSYDLTVKAGGSSYPDYFKNLGVSSKESITIINKAIEGKALTERQEFILDTFIEGYRDRIIREADRLNIPVPEFPEDTKFDKAEFIELYGEEALKNLPAKNMVIEFGMPIDESAMVYGYEDGDKFVQELFNTQPLNEAIAQRVNEKRARHDAQFKAEDYIVGTKEFSQYMDILSKYLNKNLEGTARERKLISRQAIRNTARNTIRQMSVKESQRVDKFLSAMKKAASDERRAILRKDWNAAARANEKMRFNQVMAAESVKIREKVRKILDRSKKKAKLKTLNYEHSEAIKHLTTKYKLADIVPQEPDKISDLSKLFAPEYNKDDPDAPAHPNDGFQMPDFMITPNMVKDYRGLSVDQLIELDNAIRYLAKQGIVDKDKYLTDGETELEGDVVFPAEDVMVKIKPKRKWERGSLMHRISEAGQKIFASLGSLNYTAKYLDGFTNLGEGGVKGIVERYVIDPIKRAVNARIERRAELDVLLSPHVSQIRKTLQKWGFSRIGNLTIEGAPLPDILRENGQTQGWYGNQLFAIALNANESNRERIKAGLGLTDDNLRAIYDSLSKEDWDAVRGIWSAINTLFEDVNKVHRRLKGYNVTKIEATPVNTRHGTFMAGYYPMKYDPNLDFIVEDRKSYADEIARIDANYVTPFAKSGFTQQRVGNVSLPVLLELGVIDGHINEVLQYVYMSEPIRDADRITQHKRFRAAAVKVIGRHAYKSIRPALKYIINPRRTGMDLPMARAVEWAKGIGTAWVLAWNTGVAIKQPLSTFGAVRDIGLRNYLNGFSSTLMSPMAHYEEMKKISTYMKDRLTNFDRELQRNFNSLDSKQKTFYFGSKAVKWDDVVNIGFWQIRAADTATVLPIWWGAFHSKINADQTNLQEAVEYADDIVRNSQPSAQPLDLSSWQRDGGPVRLFSMFQTFTVGKYGQRQRLHYNAWRTGAISIKDYAYFNFMDALVPLVAINMLQALIWGYDIEDDEERNKMMTDILIDWAFMGVPFANSIKYAFDSGEITNSAALKAIDQVWAGIKGTTNLKDFDNKRKRDKALWGIFNAVSITSRVPLSKIVYKAKKGEKAKKALPIVKYVIPPPKKKR